MIYSYILNFKVFHLHSYDSYHNNLEFKFKAFKEI